MIEDGLYTMVEEGFSQERCKYYEGAFTQGSGYLSIRGSLEEGLLDAPQNEEYVRLPANVTLEQPRHPLSKWGTYLPGVMSQHPVLREEMVNLPYFLEFIPSIEGEKLDMCRSQVTDYRRTMNFRTGELERTLTWHTKAGAVLCCNFRRTVDLEGKRFCVQEIELTSLSGSAELEVQSGIDGDVRTNGFDHFRSVKILEDGGVATMDVETEFDHVTVCTRLLCNGVPVRTVETGRRKLHFTGRYVLTPGETLTFCKVSGVQSSRDLEPVDDLRRTVLEVSEDPSALWERSRRAWEEKWNCCEVVLHGDELLQRALNFSLYHLIRSNAEDDPRVSICAKGHAGEAYFGRYFWDSEAAMLPFFLYTNPKAAKHLVEYRYHTLPGARENARAYGYRGARYAWESGRTGTEQCAAWNYCDHEIHITADVIHAMLWYCSWTGDQEFLWGPGAEMLTETARYWVSRAYRSGDGRWHLNGVMGPDEYLMEVNDDAYTNAMVKESLDETVRILEELRREIPRRWEELSVTEEELDAFRTLAENLVQQYGPDVALVMQCQGFAELEDIDFDAVWTDRSKPFGHFISQERNYRSKALKQGDVVQLMTMMPQLFTREQMVSAYDYYLHITTHDSSLSAGVHALLSARLGRELDTVDFLRRAANVDLDPVTNGAAEGIHIANCGNLWQAIVFGVAGLRRENGAYPSLDPHLPDGWKFLRFRFQWNGKRMECSINPQTYTIKEL